MAAAVATGSVEVIDLTAPLSSQTPILALPEPLGQTWPFALEEISRYDERGPAWYWNGFLMSVAELSTAVRLPLLVVVYNDAAYGAEVHHVGPAGHALDTVQFPDTDLAAIARGFGCAGTTVRTLADLAAVATWLAGPRPAPLVVDAKVSSARAAWWLEEAFRGH